MIADPPYNIAVQGAPWDTVPDYLAWSTKWLRACARALRPGGALFIYGSPQKLWICHLKLLAADLGLDFKQHSAPRARHAAPPARRPTAAGRAGPPPSPRPLAVTPAARRAPPRQSRGSTSRAATRG